MKARCTEQLCLLPSAWHLTWRAVALAFLSSHDKWPVPLL